MRATCLLSLLFLGATALPAAPEPRPVSPEYRFAPEPLGLPVKNPLTGWRGCVLAYPKVTELPLDPGYETLQKWYIPWNAIEDRESDGLETIRTRLDALWKGLPARDIKVIPRIVIVDHQGSYAPSDLPAFPSVPANWRESGWYTTPAVQSRLQRLIARLGLLWDGDPRVAWVEMGVQGKYGEQWGLAQMPGFARWMCAEFARSFPKKKLLFRYVGTPAWGADTSVYQEIARDHAFGYYQDSFAAPPYLAELHAIARLDGGTRWQQAVMTGEIPGANPIVPASFDDGPYEKGAVAEQVLLNCIRLGHVSCLGCDATSSPHYVVPAGSPTGAAVRQALGYHFVVTRFQEPRRVDPGKTLDLSFSVKNLGSAPFYYRWPVEVCLVNPATRERVFSKTLDAVDIRQWLPGTDWDARTQTYRQPAGENQVQGALVLPANLPKGGYVVTVAILDPEGGNLPAVRFEIRNYWKGGLHPLARLGVGVDVADGAVDPATFFTDPVDPDVHYTCGR